ncbi:hypothetical protein M0G43_02560 [Subsaxibacter sp. CAU 1640]|uniref:hypothetical protein n=1 Tax=Subsaxibacter sp. CAU 1640 TaxID=2933271 RepID=UPI00200363E3|nr:hypothetical protein [Subsaxibacter sp. CAU 1640]MCK7589448.1 hypothetical protein [Subsaxibacter sp. CAU 1640]
MPNKNLLENPILELETIKQFLPHREPMLMVDGLLYFDGTKAISKLTILDSNIFVEDNLFLEAGLIENMAQTAALLTGYKHQSENLPVKEGFIAAIKNLKIEALPNVNDIVETEVTVTYKVATMTMVNLSSKVKGEIVATAEMTLVLKEDE